MTIFISKARNNFELEEDKLYHLKKINDMITKKPVVSTAEEVTTKNISTD